MTTNNQQSIAVIGGGQAGLAVSYHLRQRGLEHVVLDSNERAGDAWRQRWDSLRLFTPTRIDHLDGLPFPRGGDVPTKDEFADYLESYEHTFDLPVRHGARVERLSTDGDGFFLETRNGELQADVVVVAMSSLQSPYVPAMSRSSTQPFAACTRRTIATRASSARAASWSSVSATAAQRSVSRSRPHMTRGWPGRRAGTCPSAWTGSSAVTSPAGSSRPRSCTC
jgi:phytoene dehydrogenase-like protein